MLESSTKGLSALQCLRLTGVTGGSSCGGGRGGGDWSNQFPLTRWSLSSAQGRSAAFIRGRFSGVSMPHMLLRAPTRHTEQGKGNLLSMNLLNIQPGEGRKPSKKILQNGLDQNGSKRIKMGYPNHVPFHCLYHPKTALGCWSPDAFKPHKHIQTPLAPLHPPKKTSDKIVSRDAVNDYPLAAPKAEDLHLRHLELAHIRRQHLPIQGGNPSPLQDGLFQHRTCFPDKEITRNCRTNPNCSQ